MKNGAMALSRALEDAEVFTDGDWVESKDQDPAGDVRLTQLADVGDGIWIDKSARFLTSKKAKQLRCTYLKSGDVLVARMPDPLGRCCIFPGDEMPCVTVVDVCVIRPNASKIAPRYLMHAINSPMGRRGISKHITGTTRQRISRKNLGKIEIPLPPLAEQKRIAGILDAADALRAKRREALDTLDTLLQSTFLDMFGDPVTNPKGWDTKTMGSLCEILTGFAFKSAEFISPREGIALCRGINVGIGEIDWDDRVDWPTPYSDRLARFEIEEGDIVLAMDRPWISNGLKAAIATTSDIPALLVQRVARIRVHDTVMRGLVFYLLRSVCFETHCHLTETTVPHISPTDLKTFPVIAPPLELAVQFANVQVFIEHQKAAQRAHLAELDTLFASLQSRAFRGRGEL